jgi:Fe2+ or Zn2+ uptake regulation protein
METLHVVTSEARAGLLADIVGHPTMATVEKPDYLNPSMSDDLIRRHLDRLEDAGVIAKHEFESGERRRDFPYQFHTVTNPARALFDLNDLFPVNAWQRQ